MSDPVLITVALCITVIEVVALLKGIDGTLLATALVALGGVGGLKLGGLLGK